MAHLKWYAQEIERAAKRLKILQMSGRIDAIARIHPGGRASVNLKKKAAVVRDALVLSGLVALDAQIFIEAKLGVVTSEPRCELLIGEIK
jgi:hypothetical protein